MSQILKCVVCGYYTDPGVMHVCRSSTGGEPVRAVYAAEKAPCVDCATYRRYADQAREELTTLRQRAEAAERRVAELEGAVKVLASYFVANINDANAWVAGRPEARLGAELESAYRAAVSNPIAKDAIDAAGGNP